MIHNRKKQRVVKSYGRLYGIGRLIETGTYAGDMVEACKNTFKEVVSIELSEPHYREAMKMFAGQKNVRLYLGDSGEVLPEILSRISEPCLFWLDGHHSGGTTARGKLSTPIREELKAIFAHKVRSHVILIDDAVSFTGNHDYPTIAELEAEVKRQRPDLLFSVRDDIIRIHPAYLSMLRSRIFRPKSLRRPCV